MDPRSDSNETSLPICKDQISSGSRSRADAFKSNESFQLMSLNECTDVEKNAPVSSGRNSSSSQSSSRRSLNLRKKSMNFLASLKSTTLTASRILTFKSGSEETGSNNDDANNSKKPIDLETHIVFNDKKKRKDRLKFIKIQKKLKNEDDEDELYPAKILTEPLEDDDEDSDLSFEEDEEISYDEDTNQANVSNDAMIPNNVSSYDDEEDDYNENHYVDDTLDNRELEMVSGCNKTRFVNLDSVHTLMKKPKKSMLSIPNAEEEDDDVNTEEEQDEVDHSNTNFTTLNKQQWIQGPYNQKMNNQTIKTPPEYSIYSHVNYLKFNETNSKLVENSPAPIKKIASKSKLNLSLPMGPPIIKKSPSSSKIGNPVFQSRQSVSFSENTYIKKSESMSGDSTTEKHIDQRNPPISQPSRKISTDEPSVTVSLVQSTDLEQEYLKTAQARQDSLPNTNNLSPFNLSESVSTTHLMSNMSITSTPYTYSPAFTHSQMSSGSNSISQNPARVLQKTMTTGSKAMRIMGNNNTMVNPEQSKLSINSKNSNQSRLSAVKKQQQRRLFFKNGNINISRCNINKRRRRYLTDIFTTLIDLKWRYNIGVISFVFLLSWLGFACAWYGISYIHGDLDNKGKDHVRCIANLNSFLSAILFSIETQQTIGYGARYTTEKCPEAIIIMMIQSSIGVMIQSFMVGVVFAKLSRPKKRSETLMFSKNAVISLRDGRLCLICRVGDMRKSHIVEAHVRMYLIKKKVTQEGEIMPLHMYDLNVGWDKGADRLFLVWPLTIEHYIDDQSPFWNISADDLKKERFELAVILEGIVENTGMTTQARSSYLCNEILWGHRFEKLITFQKEDGAYKIDYSRFNMTIPIDTPTCSAKDLSDLKEQEQEQLYGTNVFNDSLPSTLFSREIYNDSNLNGQNDLRKRRVDPKTNEFTELESETETITITNNVSDKEESRKEPINEIPEIVISHNSMSNLSGN